VQNVPHSFIVVSFSNQLCTLEFFATFNVVKLMFIAFLCYHDGA